MRTPQEWMTGRTDDFTPDEMASALAWIADVQRDALEEAARIAGPKLIEMTAVLHPTGGPTMYLKKYAAPRTEEQIAAAIRAIFP